MFRIQAGAHILRSFFLPKGRLGEGGKKREEERERESLKLFATLAIHCPSTQFRLAQVTQYPILLLLE